MQFRHAFLAVMALWASYALAQPKPQMSADRYVDTAASMLDFVRCARDEHISQSLSARGIKYLDEDLAQWAYDPALLEQAVGELRDEYPVPSARKCQDLAEATLIKAEERQKAATLTRSTPPVPQDDAWSKFLREDRERSQRDRAAVGARLQETERATQDSIQRGYVPAMSQPRAQQSQPDFGAATGEQYQTIMVNTPNGFVQKRCKVLNGQVSACF